MIHSLIPSRKGPKASTPLLFIFGSDPEDVEGLRFYKDPLVLESTYEILKRFHECTPVSFPPGWSHTSLLRFQGYLWLFTFFNTEARESRTNRHGVVVGLGVVARNTFSLEKDRKVLKEILYSAASAITHSVMRDASAINTFHAVNKLGQEMAAPGQSRPLMNLAIGAIQRVQENSRSYPANRQSVLSFALRLWSPLLRDKVVWEKTTATFPDWCSALETTVPASPRKKEATMGRNVLLGFAQDMLKEIKQTGLRLEQLSWDKPDESTGRFKFSIVVALSTNEQGAVTEQDKQIELSNIVARTLEIALLAQLEIESFAIKETATLATNPPVILEATLLPRADGDRH